MNGHDAIKEQFEQAIDLHRTGRVQEAIGAYRRVLEIQPNHADSWNNLGISLKMLGQLDDAIQCFRQAIAIDAKRAETYAYLGHLLKDTGQLDEAIESYRRGLEVQADPRIGSSLLLAMQSHPKFSPRQLYEEHRRWNRMFAEPLKGKSRPHENAREPERRLRIGYVAASLGNHPLGRFVLPLLENHDHEQFQIFCYCDFRMADRIGQRLLECSDEWRVTAGMSDEQLASLVRQDRIDILIDLNLHAASNRLLTFARKPAPIQITYLAYCGTSGLDAIDYRFSDSYLDPPGEHESVYSEKTLLLRSYWCYTAPLEAPAIGDPPCQRNRFVTFGCLNSFGKVTNDMLYLWCEILRQTPGSRLMLHAHEGRHRQRAHKLFNGKGITPDRLVFVAYQPLPDYFDLYNQIDIALDTSPWPGGTTTCDALWMGVPVVSLSGQTAVSWAGVSILSHVGLPELIASTPQQYVQTAVAVAENRSHLASLRASLRQRMQSSTLMNAPTFTADVEAAFRTMWNRWCASAPSPII